MKNINDARNVEPTLPKLHMQALAGRSHSALATPTHQPVKTKRRRTAPIVATQTTKSENVTTFQNPSVPIARN